MNNNDEFLNIKIGNTYKGLSDLNSAVEFYNKAMNINPDNPDSYFNCGLCLAEMNNLKEAITMFQKVISLKSDYEYAYYALGLAYEKQKDYKNSIDNYENFVTYAQDKNLKNNIQNKINNLKKKL